MGAVQSCLPFLKSKVPADLLTSRAYLKKAEAPVAALAPVVSAASVAATLKMNVLDDLVAIIPQVAIDEAVKKVLDTVVEKVAENVATVDESKELADNISEMEKVD